MVIETDVNVLPSRYISDVKEFQVPEKKPKMEEVLDYVYEESKRLMELSTLSARPVRRITLTRSEPTNVFRGGVQQLIIDMLEHNVRLSRTIRRNASTSARVRHCEIEGEPSAPRVKPADDSAPELLDSFLATATQSECAAEQRVWRLCQALFPSDKSGHWHWQRAYDVGDWLRDEVATLPTNKAVGKSAGRIVPYYLVSHIRSPNICNFSSQCSTNSTVGAMFLLASQVWARMCAGDGEEAMRIASDSEMTMLALMIPTALSAEETGRGDCAMMAFGIHLWWINCGGLLEDAIDSFSEDVAAGRAASPESHVYEQAQGDYEMACSHALSAGDYAAALRLFAEEVAPNAIAMGDLHKLRPLAERMEKAADKITGWGAVGQIYADYCILKTMDDEEDTEENEEKLHQLVDSIFTRINAPVFKTPIQRLCMRTMARELFEIKRLAGQMDFNPAVKRMSMERLIQ
ncbi:hypothetical protein COOONC_28430 [Cooperia oncophora]